MTTRTSPPQRRRSFRGPRRQTEWLDSIINSTIPSSNIIQVVLSDQMNESQLKGATVLRVILDLAAGLVTAGTGGVLSLGIAMVLDAAVAATSLPVPATSGEQPGWLWRASQGVFTTAPNDKSQQTLWKADIKARRRFSGADSNLVFIMETGVASANINLDGLIRVLVAKA